MSDSVAPISATPHTAAPPQAGAGPAPAEHHVTFGEILHDLNPLQYIPVVGTLYRAITGDTIPDAARTAGSLIVGALMGGPIGFAINAALMSVEKMTGIDPENIADKALAAVGVGHPPASAVATAYAQTPASAAPVPPPAVAAPPQAWSPAQLAAYGITASADGSLQRGNVSGADVLNDLELARATRAEPVAIEVSSKRS